MLSRTQSQMLHSVKYEGKIFSVSGTFDLFCPFLQSILQFSDLFSSIIPCLCFRCLAHAENARQEVYQVIMGSGPLIIVLNILIVYLLVWIKLRKVAVESTITPSTNYRKVAKVTNSIHHIRSISMLTDR